MNEESDSEQCPICFENYNETEQFPYIISPCAHTFCKKCLTNIENNDKLCPTCRKKIETTMRNRISLEMATKINFLKTSGTIAAGANSNCANPSATHSGSEFEHTEKDFTREYWTDSNVELYCYESGGMYKGALMNGLKNFFGEQSYSNGDLYIGNWKDGKRSGNGQLFYKNGDSYLGEWLDDVKYGNGVYYYNDGKNEIQNYQNDKLIGFEWLDF